MSARVEYRGAVFDESTDWMEWARELERHPWAHSELRDDLLSNGAAAGALMEALRGTPIYANAAEAGLRLLETGVPADECAAMFLPFNEAPRAGQRLLKILGERAGSLKEADRFYFLLELAMDEAAVRPAGIEILIRAIDEGERSEHALNLAAHFAPEWFGPRLRTLGRPDGLWLWGIVYAPGREKRRMMMDAVAAAGPEFIRALKEAAGDPREAEIVRRTQLALIAAHPAFAEAEEK